MKRENDNDWGNRRAASPKQSKGRSYHSVVVVGVLVPSPKSDTKMAVWFFYVYHQRFFGLITGVSLIQFLDPQPLIAVYHVCFVDGKSKSATHRNMKAPLVQSIDLMASIIQILPSHHFSKPFRHMIVLF